MTSRQRVSYRFGPLERRGLFGPVRASQAAALAVGALTAVVLLDLAPSGLGAAAGLLLFATAGAVTVLPVRGRTLDQWSPVAAHFIARRATRRQSFRSQLPAAGMLWRAGLHTPESPAASPPWFVRDVKIIGLACRGHRLGALCERRGRRLTAVLACRVASFALLEPEAQERRLARWGMVLAVAADSPVRRLQWIERTAPARADELVRWLHEARDPQTPLRGTPMVESYLELIAGSARVAQDHEVLIAIQVDAEHRRDQRHQEPQQALVEQVERIARGLEAAEIQVLGALGPGQLARALRTAFDPYGRADLAALETVDPGRDGLAAANAWPLGVQEHWDHLRADGAHHTTYWIGGWPRTEVSPMFMDAILGSSDTVRTVAVAFEPVPPARSTREVEAAVTRDRADRELRRRFGQSETARQRQAQEAALQREAELAAGHAEVRLAGYVTVSGRDAEELRLACARVMDGAARARLELHRMYGQQAAAFGFTLPLGRGLR